MKAIRASRTACCVRPATLRAAGRHRTHGGPSVPIDLGAPSARWALGSLSGRWCLRCLALAGPWTGWRPNGRAVQDGSIKLVGFPRATGRMHTRPVLPLLKTEPLWAAVRRAGRRCPRGDISSTAYHALTRGKPQHIDKATGTFTGVL